MRLLLLIAAFLYVVGFSFQPIEESITTVTAGTGSTVWEICESNYKGDVRSFQEFVQDVRKDNGLINGKVLQAGQDLVIRKKVKK